MAWRARAALAFVVLMGLQPHARAEDPPKPSDPASAAKCDPYKNYDCLDDYLGTGFFERFYNYQVLEWGKDAGPSDPKAPPSRREEFPPAAATTPPMPFTEWPYGGTTSLGVTRPNSIDSPLMTALANTSFGKWMADSHLQLYGWVNVGGNVSTNSTKPGGNAPAAYLYTPNTIQLDQAVLYLDRFPDTVQKDHIDWGLRASILYGENYRYTTSYGLQSGQLLNHNNVNGIDYPMFWGELFIPSVGQGLMLRLGRFISLPDIEAQLAPNNYMYTHSMTYTFDNYTNQGLQSTLALTKNTFLQFGVTVGTEAIPAHMWRTETNPYPNDPSKGQVNPIYPYSTFKADPGAQLSYTLCGRWNSNDGKTDINVCADAINKGNYGYNNLMWYGFTAYHRFNDQWHVAFEAYNEHSDNVPNVNNPIVQNVYANGGSPFSSNFMPYNAPNLAVCADVDRITCRANATGVVSYINYSPNALNNFSIRPEVYFDEQGWRTGTATHYTNLAFGWQHWFSPQVEVRPEIAFYHAVVPAFNGNANAGIAPSKKDATIISGDIIWHF